MSGKQKTNKRLKQFNSKKNNLNGLINKYKKIIILLAVIILAAIGAYLVNFSEAAPNNCQYDGQTPICDIDQTLIHNACCDSVLSSDNEAQSLGNNAKGIYYGAAFRAPLHDKYKGAIPVYRVYNSEATYHDYVIERQKNEKAAKGYKFKVEKVAFYAWEHQVPGTVPVYRLTRGGSITQSIFSTDKAWVDRTLAANANNNEGWKANVLAEFIAFYAYPPDYKVAGQTNPYDCSILENYVSDRCKNARENLDKAITKGDIPKNNTCPTDVNTYMRAPFPSQFDKACQDKWNNYAKDCSKQENFLSDRCKSAREALATAEAARAAATKDMKKQSTQFSKTGSKTGNSSNGATGATGSSGAAKNNVNVKRDARSDSPGSTTPNGARSLLDNNALIALRNWANAASAAKQQAVYKNSRNTLLALSAFQQKNQPSTITPTSSGPQRYQCTIKFAKNQYEGQPSTIYTYYINASILQLRRKMKETEQYYKDVYKNAKINDNSCKKK